MAGLAIVCQFLMFMVCLFNLSGFLDSTSFLTLAFLTSTQHLIYQPILQHVRATWEEKPIEKPRISQVSVRSWLDACVIIA